MPTYDYKCNDCNYTFEEFQKMTDEPLEKCPKCSGSLKRLIGTGVAPIFKGSGFYQTDYKKSTEKKTNNTKSESKPTEVKTKSETKKGSD